MPKKDERRPGDTYWVKRHERRYPSKAKPHWLAYHVKRQQFCTSIPPKEAIDEIGLGIGACEWDGEPAAANVFMKRDIKKVLEAEYDAGEIILFHEDGAK